jgi:hypothetical protein
MLMKLRSVRFLALIAFANAPLLAHAGTLRVPQDYPTIQQAIDAAADGEIVRVAAGTYDGGLIIEGKAISLIGAGARITIIDPNLTDRGITVQQVPTGTVTIAGFTIQRGATSQFAGQTHGGGIYGTQADLFVRDNIIRDNRACSGAGLAVQDGTIRMVRNRILANLADPSNCGFGEGVYLSVNGANYIDWNVIGEHQSTGLFAETETGTLYIRHNVFRDNGTTSVSRSFAALGATGNLTVENNLFNRNFGTTLGAAFFRQKDYGQGVIRENSFAENDSAPFGDGIQAMQIQASLGTNLTVTNNLMDDETTEFRTEIECVNAPVVVNQTNVFATETEVPMRGTCTR